MKIRNDYVTNSSSSSFILCFDNDDYSYEKFKEMCEEYSYNELFALIDECRKYESNTNKDSAVSQVNYILDLFKQMAANNNNKEYYMSEINRINNMHPFEKIEKADSIVMTEIWDTDGGLLEWAIRNEFLEQNFSDYLAYIMNIG